MYFAFSHVIAATLRVSNCFTRDTPGQIRAENNITGRDNMRRKIKIMYLALLHPLYVVAVTANTDVKESRFKITALAG